MKGGFNNPPNDPDDARRVYRTAASMKGGFNNPPNFAPSHSPHPRMACFNEGGVQ